MDIKLQNMEQKIKTHEHIVKERLPRQRRNVLVTLFGYRWYLNTSKKHESKVYQCKLLKAKKDARLYAYSCAEQVELFTKMLMELDEIVAGDDPNGKSIREKRKAFVKRIQSLLDELDLMKSAAQKIVNLTLEYFCNESETLENTPEEASENGDAESSNETKVNKDEQCDGTDSDTSVESTAQDGCDTVEDEEDFGVNSLPEWRPSCSLERYAKCIQLSINLAGVPLENIDIQIKNEDTLQIAGFKMPSKYDIQMERSRGIRNYGRFCIQRRISPYDFDLQNCSVNYTKSRLDIIVPYSMPNYAKTQFYNFP